MTIRYPSPEFDNAVAAACHGRIDMDQAAALNELLRQNPNALDEYILRTEIHSRLATNPDLFVADRASAFQFAEDSQSQPARPRTLWALAIAACVALALLGIWLSQHTAPTQAPAVATSRAIAMLGESAGAQWSSPTESPQPGAPLEPGLLKLDAGLAQIVFYSGARLSIEGPAELRLVSPMLASCRQGRITAEVPPQARGFRIETPQGIVTDLGTAFGLKVDEQRTEIHVFKGEVTLQPLNGAPAADSLQEGSGAIVEQSRATQRISASRANFASLFDLQARSQAADERRLTLWRTAGERLNSDPSLLARFDFDDDRPSSWQLRNLADQGAAMGDATVVGCRWGEGRWPGKLSLEFQSVSDRVRFSAPGEFDSLTVAIWARIQGLDRKLNSLFMCDGFAAGSVHWLVRNDGVLGLTVVGDKPGKYQIATSPPILTLDRFGIWIHLAVVVDGPNGRVTHYVDGQPVGDNDLRIKPPYRVGTAEIGNWNARGFPKDDPFMIRNFSGAMDEFCLFGRALGPDDVHALYSQGRPGCGAFATSE